MNIVITGGSSGIGLELARQLSARGEKVFVVCRKSTPELRELSLETLEGIDLTEAGLEEKLKIYFKGLKIDWLINNAGVFGDDHLGVLDPSQLRTQFEVNAIAPLRVTQALLPQLSRGSKIAMVTSQMGSIEETSGGYYAYRMSKAALNMAGKNLALDLKPKGISTILLHPGYVKTKMTGFHGEITPEASAKGLIKLIDQLTMENSGSYWHSNGRELPW
ncbi:MAG: SDR family oxidoreductase [Proteobacteria bacterium]|nr:SDR family oxidoreductase [Pseudomonadota bacterium]